MAKSYGEKMLMRLEKRKKPYNEKDGKQVSCLFIEFLSEKVKNGFP